MKEKITKSNALVKSSYRLSLNELRLLLYGLSKIDPKAEKFPLFHRISLEDLAKFYNIPAQQQRYFCRDIQDALINKFWGRTFTYYDDEKEETISYTWLTEIRYGKKDGTIAYHYNPQLETQLQQLSKRFTSYFLENISNLRSVYAVRFYEIAIMYLNASQTNNTVFSKTIEDIKYNFIITDKYARFCDLKKKVLERARCEINAQTDINFSYKVKKVGRTPSEIEFTVGRKPKEGARLPVLAEYKPAKLSPRVWEKAKKIVADVGNRWDLYAIEQQFYEYIERKGAPACIEAAFLGFVRTKVATHP